MNPNNREKLYFPNLNGVRFIAALLVIIHHTEQIKSMKNLDNIWENPFINSVGKLGVVLFFVLSGFLITYLLMDEKEHHGEIAIKKFYIRRVLRIWPLYFFIVFVGIFIIPNISFFNLSDWSANVKNDLHIKLLLFIFFLPNIYSVFFTPVPYVSQVWSIGVEEQFYLIWPIMVKKNIKNILKVLILIILLFICIRFFLRGIIYLDGRNYLKIFDINIIQKLSIFFENFINIDCMAIGGVGAYILFYKKEKLIKFIFNKKIQLLLYVITIVLLAKGINFKFINEDVYSLLFILIILNLAGNRESIVNLENRAMKYLGKISYGLYMYHPFVIALVINTLIMINIKINALIYILIFAITFLIAMCSYELVEKKFIAKKVKYSEIVSGENAG